MREACQNRRGERESWEEKKWPESSPLATSQDKRAFRSQHKQRSSVKSLRRRRRDHCKSYNTIRWHWKPSVRKRKKKWKKERTKKRQNHTKQNLIMWKWGALGKQVRSVFHRKFLQIGLHASCEAHRKRPRWECIGVGGGGGLSAVLIQSSGKASEKMDRALELSSSVTDVLVVPRQSAVSSYTLLCTDATGSWAHNSTCVETSRTARPAFTLTTLFKKQAKLTWKNLSKVVALNEFVLLFLFYIIAYSISVWNLIWYFLDHFSQAKILNQCTGAFCLVSAKFLQKPSAI